MLKKIQNTNTQQSVDSDKKNQGFGDADRFKVTDTPTRHSYASQYSLQVSPGRCQTDPQRGSSGPPTLHHTHSYLDLVDTVAESILKFRFPFPSARDC